MVPVVSSHRDDWLLHAHARFVKLLCLPERHGSDVPPMKALLLISARTHPLPLCITESVTHRREVEDGYHHTVSNFVLYCMMCRPCSQTFAGVSTVFELKNA